MKTSDWMLRIRGNAVREREIHESKYKFGDQHSDRYHLGYVKSLDFVVDMIDNELETIREREKEDQEHEHG